MIGLISLTFDTFICLTYWDIIFCLWFGYCYILLFMVVYIFVLNIFGVFVIVTCENYHLCLLANGMLYKRNGNFENYNSKFIVILPKGSCSCTFVCFRFLYFLSFSTLRTMFFSSVGVGKRLVCF